MPCAVAGAGSKVTVCRAGALLDGGCGPVVEARSEVTVAGDELDGRRVCQSGAILDSGCVSEVEAGSKVTVCQAGAVLDGG